jgi:hypothetical protein
LLTNLIPIKNTFSANEKMGGGGGKGPIVSTDVMPQERMALMGEKSEAMRLIGE